METKLNTLSTRATSPMTTFRKRERHSISSRVVSAFLDQTPPVYPTGLVNSLDVTFEPTVEMMIDDFDDEHTLNEEEAMASLESQDPQEEIATLQKESEMPIEELLAKYRDIVPIPSKPKAKGKIGLTIKNKTHSKPEALIDTMRYVGDREEVAIAAESGNEVIVIDSGEDENDISRVPDNERLDKPPEDFKNMLEVLTVHRTGNEPQRSHLINLYTENYGMQQVITLETIYGDHDDEDDEEEDEELDTEYLRKTIMVGSAYQAVIPIDLSKYGDVLPYENEDKLIWEPRQVSEKEVEDYLIKTREIKNYLSENDALTDKDDLIREHIEVTGKYSPMMCKKTVDTTSDLNKSNADCQLYTDATNMINEVTAETDNSKVVKDNEQALHLLVQCGYDFKEALRRKRLNAVPLSGSMSIWSEEECLKFEEGIQKFGKDFLKIRQHQVRTRSMSELVQFYYLWKKSERRDHKFVASETVDHMDMYLNEGDYNSNPTATTNLHAANNCVPETMNTRKGCSSAPNNYSIMTGSYTVVRGSSSNIFTSLKRKISIAGISIQNTFSTKPGHIRRHTSFSDKHVSSEKNDCQNVLMNMRK